MYKSNVQFNRWVRQELTDEDKHKKIYIYCLAMLRDEKELTLWAEL